MTDAILVLNAGSSSIKFALFPAADEPMRRDVVCEGSCDGIGHAIHFSARDRAGAALADEHWPQGETHKDALAGILRWVPRRFPEHRLIAAGHRVVHGGTHYKGPVRIDADVVAELSRLVPLAPLHQPHHLAAIAALARLHPSLPQVACFDTSFHHTQAEVATAFALPRWLRDEGVRRYGFHGLSYEYIASIGSQGRRYRCAARFPHPPFNPYVRFSRIRLTDDLLDMVTPPSDSGWCRAVGAGRAR
jgi:acetate kinase